jgi:hypothetical protein
MRSTIVQRLAALARVAALLASVAADAAAQPAEPPNSDDPFARRGWHLELGGHWAPETWNYNRSREVMEGMRAGLTYGVGKGITLLAAGPLYHVSQRGVDGYLLGATFGVRGRVMRRSALSAYLEFEVGVSESDTFVPPGGTRFNYLALGGAGVTVRLRRGIHLVAGLKWVHVSNNSLAGRSRNPDIEAVGPYASLLVGF